jgi:RNA polymerase sigma factor (sigma-70 family)
MTAVKDGITTWYNYAGRYRVLDQYEFDVLIKQMKQHEPGTKEYTDILNKLTMHNLKLVIKFVSNFVRANVQNKMGTMDMLDYLQVGTIGLRRAIECYDPAKGYKFSTYAVPWIRSLVSRYNLKVSSVFHITENALLDAWQYKTYGEIRSKSSKNKTAEECVDLVKRIQAMQNPISVDADVCGPGETEGTELVKRLESHYKMYDSSLDFNMEMEDLVNSAGLTKMQIKIIKASFIQELTTHQIKELYGISVPEIKRSKQKALAKLKDALSQL